MAGDPCGRRRAARTCCSSSSTTPGSASSAATAVRSRPRTSTGSPPTGCASRTCTPRRCARRAVRASSPAATTTPTAWPASPSWRPVYPGYNGVIPFENGFLSEMLVAQGYNTFMVGKWHLSPSVPRPPPAPTTGGRSAVASSASTASSAATPASGIRTSSTTTTRSSRPDAGGGLPPHRGPGRQVDRVHRRRQAGRPGQAVLPAPVLRRDARSAPRTQGVGRPLRRDRFDDGWDAYRDEGVRPAEGARSCSRRHRAVAARPRRPRLGLAVARRPPAVRPA